MTEPMDIPLAYEKSSLFNCYNEEIKLSLNTILISGNLKKHCTYLDELKAENVETGKGYPGHLSI